ncbi:hypothetical protein JRO89_XS15G0006100 [Xanthoceras sorbifolium]|uniref:Sulfotransferase n=1 Tax=Xanthoceras sorbifolium TaxID=99658 RepID=A0ABQ8H0I9_9ROSI|nr:hypothetical protein JRO89_XS15G0006100 [Xanthoceras sorbifolium]
MEKLLDFQNKEDQELLLTLPRVKSWDFPYLYQCQGFWSASMFLHGIISFQKHFQAKDTDIILVTFPKSGASWLKTLTFNIVNRSRYTLENTPLLTTSPHDLVPFLEIQVYGINQFSILEDLHTPRTLATHLPYASLPPSIISSSCRIVYLCRNPLDQFISHWHFAPKIQDQAMTEPILLDDAFEMFCQGVQCYGPIWDHMLGYWKASLEKPDKILFLKYEDLQEDIISCLKKLADFLGCPFTDEEETRGVIEELSKFSSFDNMRNLEVNKTGTLASIGIENNFCFRKGKVGDWTNHLSLSTLKRLEKVMEEKLGESPGLMTFKFNQSSSGERDLE